MSDIAREWTERARKAQEAISELGAGPPASRLADDDRELTAEARRVAVVLRDWPSADARRYAARLLAELADRLDDLTPKASVWAFCKRCEQGTASVPCPRDAEHLACSVCGRCPPCDGDLPAEEETVAAAALEPPGPGVRCHGCGALPDEQHDEGCPERDPGPVWSGDGE
jgi:hypothetical protein